MDTTFPHSSSSRTRPGGGGKLGDWLEDLLHQSPSRLLSSLRSWAEAKLYRLGDSRRFSACQLPNRNFLLRFGVDSGLACLLKAFKSSRLSSDWSTIPANFWIMSSIPVMSVDSAPSSKS